jgi:hypothetical protein
MDISAIITWFQSNGKDLLLIYTSLVTAASIVVKLTPTLKDDDALKGVIKFIGKFIALNR